jgi:hypothetical protein
MHRIGEPKVNNLTPKYTSLLEEHLPEGKQIP